MKKSLIEYFIILFSIITFSQVNSQTCGFGCLGLSGIYGGYSLQQYEADGLNSELSILSYSSSFTSDPQFDFKEARGLKVGMNLVRAEYTNFFFTFKGFYQFLSEKHSAEYSLDTPIIYDVKLEMNNWGIGLDFGIPLIGFIDWKIVEGELKFFSPKLTLNISNRLPNSVNIEKKYTPNRVKMGYSVGSGLIFNIIKDYVSIEATGMFTFFEIDNLTDDLSGASIITNANNKKFISKGGLQAFVQLNVGIPF